MAMCFFVFCCVLCCGTDGCLCLALCDYKFMCFHSAVAVVCSYSLCFGCDVCAVCFVVCSSCVVYFVMYSLFDCCRCFCFFVVVFVQSGHGTKTVEKRYLKRMEND